MNYKIVEYNSNYKFDLSDLEGMAFMGYRMGYSQIECAQIFGKPQKSIDNATERAKNKIRLRIENAGAIRIKAKEQEVKTPASRLDHVEMLMAQGLNKQAIASRLGMNDRTAANNMSLVRKRQKTEGGST